MFVPCIWISMLIIAAFGAGIGLIIGWPVGKIFREGIRSMAMILTDAAAGAAGFILGCMLIVASDWSIYEKYDNGNLAVRETTGLIDYVWVFAAAGAVILVVLVHLCKAIIKRLPCKRRAGKNHPNPIHAV